MDSDLDYDLYSQENINKSSNNKPHIYDTIEDFFNYNYKGNWNFINYDGKVSIINGGYASGVGTTDNELLKFSQIIGKYFMIPKEQLPNIMLISRTIKARHYYIPQTINGLHVYNSGIQLSVDEENNSIYQINNTLRNIKSYGRRYTCGPNSCMGNSNK